MGDCLNFIPITTRRYSRDNRRYYISRKDGYVCYESSRLVVLDYQPVKTVGTEQEAERFLGDRHYVQVR